MLDQLNYDGNVELWCECDDVCDQCEAKKYMQRWQVWKYGLLLLSISDASDLNLSKGTEGATE